jgi:excisionase family DNA binding protein
MRGSVKKPVRRGDLNGREGLPVLRVEVVEAARILRMSRAQLYKRIRAGSLRTQKDGTRTYITYRELERYVESCDPGRDRST